MDATEPRRIAKVNSAFAPFAELGDHVFGKKNDRRVPADELVFFRLGVRGDQPQHGDAVRRGDGDQAVAGLKADIQSQIESQPIPVEFQTPILIFDKNVDGVNAEVGILAVQTNGGYAAHGRNYRLGRIWSRQPRLLRVSWQRKGEHA